MKNENDEKNKKIELVEEDKNKIENNKDFLNNNNKDKKKNNDDNYIICEYNIKNKDNIQILNSYEEVVRNNIYYKGKGIENEKEIKDNCEIYLNENKINFNYKYELEGKNIIKIKCINSLNNTNFMFCDCSSLTSLDLSNFNTDNVKDMSYMFYYCTSLTSLDLFNFNTNNVKDMREMFSHCSSLNFFKNQRQKNIKRMEK
jgi:surface protein